MQAAILPKTNFTINSFWNIFQKLASLNKYFEEKVYGIVVYGIKVNVRFFWKNAENPDIFTEKPPCLKLLLDKV